MNLNLINKKRERNLISTKNTKIGQVWWHAPVSPATQEAEAGELLEPRRQKLQWAETAPLHSSLGDKSKTRLEKKKVEERTILNQIKFEALNIERYK